MFLVNCQVSVFNCNIMFIINHKNFFLGLSLLLMIVAVTLLGVWGLRLGIDFTGGTLLEVRYVAEERPTVSEAREALTTLGFANALVQPSGETNMVVRLQEIDETTRLRVLAALAGAGLASDEPAREVALERFTSIGPVIGSELRQKSWIAIVAVLGFIILFIAFAFRHVSAPIASWKYGLTAVVTLLHDVLVPTGVMVIFGRFLGFEADILFVTALLAILGFSVHDTIVVFDRVRENLKERISADFKEVVGKSLRETLARSVNTSITTLVVLLALYFFGGESTRVFALVLSIGIIAGTYSSVFFASPLLVFLEERQREVK